MHSCNALQTNHAAKPTTTPEVIDSGGAARSFASCLAIVYQLQLFREGAAQNVNVRCQTCAAAVFGVAYVTATAPKRCHAAIGGTPGAEHSISTELSHVVPLPCAGDELLAGTTNATSYGAGPWWGLHATAKSTRSGNMHEHVQHGPGAPAGRVLYPHSSGAGSFRFAGWVMISGQIFGRVFWNGSSLTV